MGKLVTATIYNLFIIASQNWLIINKVDISFVNHLYKYFLNKDHLNNYYLNNL